jgi:hypothetical protein
MLAPPACLALLQKTSARPVQSAPRQETLRVRRLSRRPPIADASCTGETRGSVSGPTPPSGQPLLDVRRVLLCASPEQRLSGSHQILERSFLVVEAGTVSVRDCDAG